MKSLNAFSMKLSPWSRMAAIGSIAVASLIAACGDDSSKTASGTEEDSGIVAIEDKTISGVSQKGPFVNGSSVTVYGLDGETLAQTGNIYEGKIKSDMGDFSVKVVKLASQYALLKANGFYRNEVTGEKSNSQVTLYALTDLSDRDEVNVNLLTHLAYERSLYLATDSMSVANAKKQAEAEVFKSFDIEGDFDVAEDLNIFGENDQNAALLAISVLMQGDLKEADFSERLDNYARDIETDGVWDDKKTATAVADWASEKSLGGGLATIRVNVEKWGQLFGVPPFEKYVNNFWWQNYGLGTCDKKRQGEVKANGNALSVKNGVHFICDNSAWREATDIEKDTYKWEAGKDADIKNGDVVKSNCYVFEGKAWRSGNVSDCSLNLRGCTSLRQDTVGQGKDKAWYICDNRNWRDATTYEKDTFGWKDSTDGAIKKGNVTDSIYVFDKTAWRATSNVEEKLGGCVSAVADSVGKVGGTYYICKSNKWEEASAIEYDTYHWASAKDGDAKSGSVNAKNCYVFEDKVWRSGKTTDCSLGLRGCTALRQDTVGQGKDKVWHICDTKSWRDATNIEKDTATWGAGKFDGEVRAGQVNINIYYIYEVSEKAWRKATVLEYDTYQVECTKDGMLFDGVVSKTNKYVCDADTFRTVNSLEENVGLGCVSYNRNEYVMPANLYSYYKCGKNGWFVATDKLNLSSVVDSRDGQEYETVGIGTQIWMRGNMNYETDCRMTDYKGDTIYPQECAICPSKELSLCDEYGKLYWNGRQLDEICPDGWHEPSFEEWRTVISFLGEYKEVCENEEEWCVGGELGLTVFEAYFSNNIFSGNFHIGGYDENENYIEEFFYGDLGKEGRFITSSGQNSRFVIFNSSEQSSDKIYIVFDILVDYQSKSVRCVKDKE